MKPLNLTQDPPPACDRCHKMAEIAKADKGRKCPARAALPPAARADVTAGDRSENCAHIGLERPNQSSRQPPRSLEKQIKNWLLPLCYPTVRNWR